jgi:hypothetical protein
LNLCVRGNVRTGTHSLSTLGNDLITTDNQRAHRRVIRQEGLLRQFNTASDVVLVFSVV